MACSEVVFDPVPVGPFANDLVLTNPNEHHIADIYARDREFALIEGEVYAVVLAPLGLSFPLRTIGDFKSACRYSLVNFRVSCVSAVQGRSEVTLPTPTRSSSLLVRSTV